MAIRPRQARSEGVGTLRRQSSVILRRGGFRILREIYFAQGDEPAYNRSICACRLNATRRTRRKRGQSVSASRVMNISSRKWLTSGTVPLMPGTKFEAMTGISTFCGAICPFPMASGTWFHSARLHSSRPRLRRASTDPDLHRRLHPSLPVRSRFPRYFPIPRPRVPEARGAHTSLAKCS